MELRFVISDLIFDKAKGNMCSGIAYDNRVWADVIDNDSSRPDNSAPSDNNGRYDNCSVTDPDVFANVDFRSKIKCARVAHPSSFPDEATNLTHIVIPTSNNPHIICD
jgi:hypothetical protein